MTGENQWNETKDTARLKALAGHVQVYDSRETIDPATHFLVWSYQRASEGVDVVRRNVGRIGERLLPRLQALCGKDQRWAKRYFRVRGTHDLKTR